MERIDVEAERAGALPRLVTRAAMCRCPKLAQVDVSGFTKLSEAYSQKGPEGCEHFSLIMSSFLARMSDIIASHDGDIDCFAGDALLVVFSVQEAGVAQSLCDLGGGSGGGGVMQRLRLRGRSTVGEESLTSSSGELEERTATGQAQKMLGGRIRVVRRTLSDLNLRLTKQWKGRSGSSSVSSVSSCELANYSTRSSSIDSLSSVAESSDASSIGGLGPDRKKRAVAKRSASVMRGLGQGPRQDDTAETSLLAAAVSSAISCAVAISQELNGFQASPQDPPLSIHAGLAAGEIYAIECGE